MKTIGKKFLIISQIQFAFHLELSNVSLFFQYLCQVRFVCLFVFLHIHSQGLHGDAINSCIFFYYLLFYLLFVLCFLHRKNQNFRVLL